MRFTTSWMDGILERRKVCLTSGSLNEVVRTTRKDDWSKFGGRRNQKSNAPFTINPGLDLIGLRMDNLASGEERQSG